MSDKRDGVLGGGGGGGGGIDGVQNLLLSNIVFTAQSVR